MQEHKEGQRQPKGVLKYPSVITPNVGSLPWTMDGDVKVFHLIAEPIRREFAPGFWVNCWGYNGSSPGPTLEAVEGDRVRILVTNKLNEVTSVHWHGIILPNGMDGVAGLNQRAIPPGDTFKYEFTLKQKGRLSLIVGPPENFIDLSAEQILARVIEDARKINLDFNSNIKDYRKVVWPADFYLLSPGNEILKPTQQTPITGLTLAGDYTKQPFLASMEGAALSGKLAALSIQSFLI